MNRQRKHTRVWRLAFLLLATTLVTVPAGAGEYSNRHLNEQLTLATLWYQTSAEMRAASYQAFNLARMRFDMDLKESSSGKKRAVIVDIDETVLDNSPYEAGLIGRNYGYPKGWQEWCEAARAAALPGAVEFLQYVDSKGAAVFYLSNRKDKVRAGTMKNLQALGFPQVVDSQVLLRTETSDKEPRRQAVAAEHRIVLLMGDNLGDFDSVFRGASVARRAGAADLLKNSWGDRFIVLPNPMYGDWEGAIYEGNWKLSPEDKSDARKDALDTWNL
jgi:5'-nucleotidase (lipoprotein e(P4) family)